MAPNIRALSIHPWVSGRSKAKHGVWHRDTLAGPCVRLTWRVLKRPGNQTRIRALDTKGPLWGSPPMGPGYPIGQAFPVAIRAGWAF